MRTSTSLCTVLITASLALTSIARAEEAPSAVNLPPVNVQQSSGYKLAPHQFDAYADTYRLDSGATLRVWQKAGRYYGQVSGQAVHELKAQSARLFRTSEGATLTFMEDGSTVTVNHFGTLMAAMH